MPAEISASVPRRQLRVYYREAERGKSANIQNVRTVKIFLFLAVTVKKSSPFVNHILAKAFLY
jgi:hypothetical protein